MFSGLSYKNSSGHVFSAGPSPGTAASDSLLQVPNLPQSQTAYEQLLFYSSLTEQLGIKCRVVLGSVIIDYSGLLRLFA